MKFHHLDQVWSVNLSRAYSVGEWLRKTFTVFACGRKPDPCCTECVASVVYFQYLAQLTMRMVAPVLIRTLMRILCRIKLFLIFLRALERHLIRSTEPELLTLDNLLDINPLWQRGAWLRAPGGSVAVVVGWALVNSAVSREEEREVEKPPP